jgi:hypothetical protein
MAGSHKSGSVPKLVGCRLSGLPDKVKKGPGASQMEKETGKSNSKPGSYICFLRSWYRYSRESARAARGREG